MLYYTETIIQLLAEKLNMFFISYCNVKNMSNNKCPRRNMFLLHFVELNIQGFEQRTKR